MNDEARPSYARRSDPWTSHAAAYDARKYRGKVDRKIYKLLYHHGPLTQLETAEQDPALGLVHNNISSRFVPMMEKGWIRKTGSTRQHPRTRAHGELWDIVPLVPTQADLF